MKKQRKTKKSLNGNNSKISIIFNCIQTLLIIILLIHMWGSTETPNKTTEPVVEETTKKSENFVFLGDSITDWYPFYDFFSDDTPIINSGFAGYNTKALLNHDLYDTVYKYNPTKVFIQIGTNDIGTSDSSVEVAYNNISKIVENIKENRPAAEIYVESIYPVNQDCEKTNKEATGNRDNHDIIELNKRLKDFCENNDAEYVDIYNALSDEVGNLRSEYTTDGLHLSIDGYSKVSKVLKKYIEE